MRNNLSPWNVKENKFPVNGKMSSKLKFLLNYAILAPSGHNSQPWKFALADNLIEILPDYSKTRKEVDPLNRELFISLGAAAKNIEIAALNFGMMYEKDILNDKIVIKFKNGVSLSSSTELFKAIVKRNTNRGEYYVKSIEKEKIEAINKIPGKDAFIKIIEDKDSKKEVAKLVQMADIVWFKSRSLTKELTEWLRDDLETSKDGLPTSVLSLYKVAVEMKYLFSSDSEYAKKRAKKDSDQAINSPIIIAVATKEDKIKDWIEAGGVFETLALKLTSLGLNSGFFNTVVQLKNPRNNIAKIFKINGVVQMLLRVGYAKEKMIRTQRRPIDEVLLKIG